MSDLRMVVDGIAYGGWKTIQVTRSIETVTGKFVVSAVDKWAGDQSWPIIEGDECKIVVNDQPLITGFVEVRSSSANGQNEEVSFEGRDRTSLLVDCSPIFDKWTFRRKTVVDIAREVCGVFNIPMIVDSGLDLGDPEPKIVITPGTKAWEAIHASAKNGGVLFVGNGQGGLRITQAGKAGRGESLVEGENCHVTAKFSVLNRFYRYVVLGSIPSSDDKAGKKALVRAESYDEGVRNTDRVKVLRPSKISSQAYALRRADWEARVRAARSEVVTVQVFSWTQRNGALWQPNQLHYIKAPRRGIDGTMLCTSVTYNLTMAGETATLSFMRPDAFTPSPRAPRVKSPNGEWKELNKGA